MLEWLAKTDSPSERKLRLFGAALCRLTWGNKNNFLRRPVVLAELFADGRTTPERLRKAELTARVDYDSSDWGFGDEVCAILIAGRPFDVARTLKMLSYSQGHSTASKKAALVRDIFGPLPFRSVPFDPAWRTPSVLKLAQAIYEHRSFDRLPELADLLEEQGCDSSELLEHLRSPGPHYLGTWSLDAVLGRA